MKQTLGEERIGTCQICQAPFPKTRFDAKFCSTECRTEAKKFYNRTRWLDRTDRETMNEKRKERYYAARPQVLENLKQWRRDNPEEAKAKDRAKYEANKEKHIARTNAYRKAHPEVRQKEFHNARQKRPWRQCLANARNRSLKKGFSFDLTREWCEQNWTGTCALTGLPFMFGTQTLFPFSPSIDRIKSSEGYTQNNCRFVLFAVNSFKGTGTDEQMLEIANALISLSKSRPGQIVAVESRDGLGTKHVVTTNHDALLADLPQRDQ